jgi:hypothetical protein
MGNEALFFLENKKDERNVNRSKPVPHAPYIYIRLHDETTPRARSGGRADPHVPIIL